MTPLLGTKTPSALVGAKSGGDGRTARSLLSCALWRAMGRLWRGMGGGRPPRRQHGLYAFHESQLPYPRFPTISHDFPAFPGISRPPPPPIKCPRAVRLSWSAARTAAPPGRCFPARCGAAWGGYGAAWAAWGAPSHCSRTVRTGNRAFRVFTKHETRPFSASADR